jgi:hypothetical protein
MSEPSSSSTRRAWKTRCHTPRFAHRAKRLYVVFQLPYRSGMSRQGAPVLSRHITALTKERSPRRERGPRVLGNRSRRVAHWTSLSSCRCTRIVAHARFAKAIFCAKDQRHSGSADAKLGARAAGNASDGTYVGAPLAQRADASRSPRKSWTRAARPLTSVPGGGVPGKSPQKPSAASAAFPSQAGVLGTAPSPRSCALPRLRWEPTPGFHCGRRRAAVPELRHAV